jgi:hypothetical protein
MSYEIGRCWGYIGMVIRHGLYCPYSASFARSMPLVRTKEWTQHLPDGFTVEVVLTTFLKRIASFSVVLIKDNQCVTRYDTAHGFAHRDVLGRKSASPLVKIRYTMRLTEVFNYARKDLTENYAKHYEYYDCH